MTSFTWEFTLNNFTDEDCKWVRDLNAPALVCAKEEAESGTPHLQGKIRFNCRKRLATLKKMHPRIHWELSKAPNDWTYPQKIDSDIIRNDPYISKQGSRLDLVKAADTILGKRRWIEVIRDPELYPIMSKYGTWAKSIYQSKKTIGRSLELRSWQQEIVDFIKTEPNDRTINWYYEHEGNFGKTALALYLCDHHDAVIVSGEYKRIAYQYDNEPIVIWNVPRDQNVEHISYKAMENLKDGFLNSTMYVPVMKRFTTPHVLVFANAQPFACKLSDDRWNMINLRAEE